MKFLIGLLIGIGLSIAIVLQPQTRLLLPEFPEPNGESTAMLTSSATEKAVLETAEIEPKPHKHTLLEPTPPVPVASTPAVLRRSVASNNKNTIIDELTSPTNMPRALDTAKTDDTEPDNFQIAWTPFRSKASAKGFARVLQGKLDHAFSVKKLAPGKYAAGFYYGGEQQRKQQLAAVESFISAQQLETSPP